MDNTHTAQAMNPSSSSNETIAEDRQTTTDVSSTNSSPSSSYCPDCPICNPPNTKSTNFSAYGTIESRSPDTQSPKLTSLEASLEACAEICCCICDSPPPSVRTSEWSSTPYPSSLSSNSYSYGETETGSSQDQTSDAETIHEQSLPRHEDGYKRQQEMRSTKDESIVQYPQKSFQRSE